MSLSFWFTWKRKGSERSMNKENNTGYVEEEKALQKKIEKSNLNKSIIIDIMKTFGIHLSERQADQFLDYYCFLVEKNKVMNLTAITDYEEVVLKHFTDSLSIVKVIDMEKCSNLIDIGTGAGFPGIPLKIVYPHLNVVLLDSLKKRISFLDELMKKLSLNGIEAVHARAEDAARNSIYRERFELCVSRAVANLSSLSEYCLPFVREDGVFVSYKSMDIDTEIEDAKSAIALLGGTIEEKKDFYLPASVIGRSLVVIKKIKKTPSRYPRKAGLPSKEPL